MDLVKVSKVIEAFFPELSASFRLDEIFELPTEHESASALPISIQSS